MRWSQNTNKRRREIVRLKVGDFAQQGARPSLRGARNDRQPVRLGGKQSRFVPGTRIERLPLFEQPASIFRNS